MANKFALIDDVVSRMLDTCSFSEVSKTRKKHMRYRLHQSRTSRITVSVFSRLVGVLAITSLSACGKSPQLDDLASAPDSIYGTRTVRTRAVIITKGQKPYPLESLAIHGSPESDVKQALAPVLIRLKERLEKIDTEIDETNAKLKNAKDQIEEIDTEYREKLPDASEKPNPNQRNSVKLLEKWRAQEITARDWHREQVAPIKTTIQSLDETLQVLRGEQTSIRKYRIKNEMFAGLPRPKKTWKTYADGQASLKVPNSGTWIVWAATSRELPTGQTEHYRWICRVPEDLDSNGALVLDNSNLLENRRGFDIFDESPREHLERHSVSP